MRSPCCLCVCVSAYVSVHLSVFPFVYVPPLPVFEASEITLLSVYPPNFY
jgi:hypothetical protein